MAALSWNRVPPALRVGLLMAMASQVGRLGIAAVWDDTPRAFAFARGLMQAAWVAGDVMCLLGALQLAKRTPRATLLVIGYALVLTLSVLWLGFQVVEVRSYDAMATWLALMRWLTFATALVVLVAWAHLAGGAGRVVGIAVTMLLATPPPVADDLFALVTHSFAMQSVMRALVQLAALAMSLIIAMGVTATRPVLPRPLSRGFFYALVVGVLVVGAAELAQEALVPEIGLATVMLDLAVAGAAFWLAALTAGARGVGEPGVWALHGASAAWASAGVMCMLLLPMLLAWGRGGEISFDSPDRVLLPLCALLGVVLALVGIAQIARARGAERARRVARTCAGIAVVSGLLGLGASVGSTAIPEVLRLVAFAAAFGTAAFGFRAAGAALGGGVDVPTATLRAALVARGIDRD